MEDGRVQRVLPLGRVHAIIGGFHLTGAKPEVTVKTVAGIKAFRPDYIVPIYCAGHEAISAFAREVPNRFILRLIRKYDVRQWAQAGFFSKLWEAGLTEYDELKGIAWDWQSIDGVMTKAPLAQESVGRNPTDPGKKGNQTTPLGRWPRYPSRDRGHRGQSA
jgi:hypothetical protein